MQALQKQDSEARRRQQHHFHQQEIEGQRRFQMYFLLPWSRFQGAILIQRLLKSSELKRERLFGRILSFACKNSKMSQNAMMTFFI